MPQAFGDRPDMGRWSGIKAQRAGVNDMNFIPDDLLLVQISERCGSSET